MEFQVFRTKERGSDGILHGVFDVEEDLIHTDVGHTGALENAVIDEIAQAEPGDLIIIRAVKA